VFSNRCAENCSGQKFKIMTTHKIYFFTRSQVAFFGYLAHFAEKGCLGGFSKAGLSYEARSCENAAELASSQQDLKSPAWRNLLQHRLNS